MVLRKKQEPEVMSNSKRGRVTGCAMAYYFSDILKLRKKKKARALDMGIMWHEALAKLFRGEVDLQGAIDYLLSLDVISSPEETFEEQAKKTADINLLVAMMKNYESDYNYFIERYEVLEVEFEYLIRIKNNPHKTGKYFPNYGLDLMSYKTGWTQERLKRAKIDFKKSGINFVTGFLDLIVRERSTGKVFAVEHKTCKETGPETYERVIKWSFQIIGYSLATALYCIKHNLELGGYIYNVARKAECRMPVLNQCKKCKGKGISGSGKGKNRVFGTCESCNGTGFGAINKQSTNVNLIEVEKLFEKYPHLVREDHEKFIRNVSVNKYFWQHKGLIGYKKMEDWIADSIAVIGESRRLKRLHKSKFVRHMNNFVGGCATTCSYKELCFMESQDDFDFMVEDLYISSLPAIKEIEKEEEDENLLFNFSKK